MQVSHEVTSDEARRFVESATFVWHQRWELSPGVMTPGANDIGWLFSIAGLDAELLDGAHVLDIGTTNGAAAFEAERRGAARVVAVDILDDQHFGFGSIRALLRSDVEFLQSSVYELPALLRGDQFDVVLLWGVLYHLRHPLLALDCVRRTARGRVMIESAICDHELPPAERRADFVRFYRRDELGADPTNWFAPTLAALTSWCGSCGLDVLEATSWPADAPTRGHASCVVAPGLPEAFRMAFEQPLEAHHTTQPPCNVASAAPAFQGALGPPEFRAEELAAQVSSIGKELAALRDAVATLNAAEAGHLRLARAQYDDIRGLRERIRALRQTDPYAATFDNREPLVSVPIATYNASRLLVERSIASVRAQTYERWEVIVVGDGCTDDTADRIAALGDPRIRFINLPFRSTYPELSADRWLVSGVMPYNRAVELCRGEWLAPQDDDDEFLPGHIEVLLELALERRAEFVYGALERVTEMDTEPSILFSFPPEHERMGMQASLHLRSLDFFECDSFSWVVGQPADWNVVRRMRDAGVIMAATEEVVARYYPSGWGASRP